MPVGAAIGAAGIGGALISSSAISSATNAATRSSDAATQLQADIYNQQREDFAPWRNMGMQALNQMGALYGFKPYTSGQTAQAKPLPANGGTSGQSAPDYSAFYNSPDYKFARDEGMRGVESSLAARGALLGGGAQREIARYSSGLASQQYGTYVNRLAALAGVGQTATSQLAGLGSQYGQQAGQNMMNAGNARASGYQQQGAIWGNALGDLAYGAGRYNWGGGGNVSPMSPMTGAGGYSGPQVPDFSGPF